MRLPRLTKPYKLRDYKFSLVLLVFALSVIGVMVVGSAKASVQNKQIFGVCVGFVLMIIVSLSIIYGFLIFTGLYTQPQY